MDLYGFAGAYSAVVYLPFMHENSEVEVRFIAARSRLALIQKLSVPSLELMAALLCARLDAYVKREVGLQFRSVLFGAIAW
ncbi:hypothetical protein T11_2576 [Trichinella zimbabwensis]|uniref:Uncharacterized protein n=1 Tax=Trichinella zimbabwensis TaxID=268475 RepID=A0A0V1H634_9BILA|nr:hypothetical protein T11_2576 [Trichinella zimbabwensis]